MINALLRSIFDKIAEAVTKVLFFCEFWHSTLDSAKKSCYNSGVLRRKGKRRAARLPGKPFARSFKM